MTVIGRVRTDICLAGLIDFALELGGLGHRSYCTGTLIGPRQVLTAAHCLFDTRLNTWVKPQQVHFVAGQSRDGKFQEHACGGHVCH